MVSTSRRQYPDLINENSFLIFFLRLRSWQHFAYIVFLVKRYVHKSGRGRGLPSCYDWSIFWRRLQSETTYCAAFCASLTLVAGSGNNLGGYGGKNSGFLVRYARMSLGWFYFVISLLRKLSSPTCWRALLLCIQWCSYMDALWECCFAPKFLI